MLATAREIPASCITRYRLARPVSFCGFVAECVADVGGGQLACVALHFDLIQFFDRTVLESKILTAVERKSGLRASSVHPTSARLEPCLWGSAEFSYDPRQGDLSLLLTYPQRHREATNVTVVDTNGR